MSEGLAYNGVKSSSEAAAILPPDKKHKKQKKEKRESHFPGIFCATVET